jgi:hypothetical protein
MVLLRATRIVFRALCWLATSVGRVMAALADAFKSCGRASADHGALVVPAQTVLLIAWVPVRLLFLVLEWAARSVYRLDANFRRRWALGGSGAA